MTIGWWTDGANEGSRVKDLSALEKEDSMTIDFKALGKRELTSYGYREALRLDEEEAREINDVLTRCARAGVRVRLVIDGMNRLVVEGVPSVRR